MGEKRLCDYCNVSTALLYCRADSAKLCISCDREVHETNKLFSKHTRSLLCDSCDASPASIFCETEHSVLCHNCDWERHNLSSTSVHNRRPIEGFSGYRSLGELLSIWGFEDLGEKSSMFLNEESNNGLLGCGSGCEDGYSDLLVWESPTISIDDLIGLSDSTQNFQALDVPPLPKNRNAACGQHKEEILNQLRELARSEPDSNWKIPNSEPVNVFYSSEILQPQVDTHTRCEENVCQWIRDPSESENQASLACTGLRSDLEESIVVPDKFVNGNHEVCRIPKSHEINSQERDSAISRYKEKRKTRRFDKHIRYESRKVRAESRTRIRGRFAKTDG